MNEIKPLIITINEQGLVLMKFNGNLTKDVVPEYKAELDKGAEYIETFYKNHTKKVKVILDMTDFTGNYSLDALGALFSFAKHNTQYVDHTASFGGSDKVKMAGEVAIALSGRENIKICDTKEEALQWVGESTF